jgi:Fe-S cluster biogenesis protein NfuA
VLDHKDFQNRMQRIGGLVQDLDSIIDPAARASARELVQLLMDLHGTALERIMEIVFESGESGPQVIDELGQDQLVNSLLVLYGLHPDDLETRVERKLKQIGSALHKMGAEAKLVAVNGGEVRVLISVEGHTCGSTKSTARTIVEDAMYEAAPDLTSLLIEGLEEPFSSGFVSVESLLVAAPPPRVAPDDIHALVSKSMD